MGFLLLQNGYLLQNGPFFITKWVLITKWVVITKWALTNVTTNHTIVKLYILEEILSSPLWNNTIAKLQVKLLQITPSLNNNTITKLQVKLLQVTPSLNNSIFAKLQVKRLQSYIFWKRYYLRHCCFGMASEEPVVHFSEEKLAWKDEKDSNESKEIGVGELWKDFSENTGFHAFNKLSPGRNYKIRW